MKIYIDSDFKCHVNDDGTMCPVENEFFDGKCLAFIEGYRYIPDGMVWVREDGSIFQGEMIAPWKPFLELERLQLSYEHERLPSIVDEYETIIADLVEEIYQQDLEMIDG